MLRSRQGQIQFKVLNKDNGGAYMVRLKDHITEKQQRKIAAYPDFIWQFSQYLKQEHKTKGENISVYALNSQVSINGKSYKPFIDPKVDLANTKWDHFGHHEWILPSNYGQKERIK
jgi:hypothetical protein